MGKVTIELTREEAVRVLQFLSTTGQIITVTAPTPDSDRLPPPPPVADPPPPVTTEEEADEPAGDGSGLDSAGIPWDERIHASTKTKISDGTWKRKRGITQGHYDSVVAQLKAAPATVAEQPLPPPPPVVTPEPAPLPPPPPVVAEPTNTYADFDSRSLAWISGAESTADRVARAKQFAEVLKQNGYANKMALKDDPDGRDLVATLLGF